MSMTPAEMREMAAKVAENAEVWSEYLDWNEGRPPDALAAGDAIAKAIRAIPDTTAADDAVIVEAREGVCNEIQFIMAEYRKQDAEGSVDTPGGLEHMGDVWRQLAEWDNTILSAIDAAKAKGGYVMRSEEEIRSEIKRLRGLKSNEFVEINIYENQARALEWVLSASPSPAAIYAKAKGGG